MEVTRAEIEELTAGNRKVQKMVFERLYPALLGVCKMYSPDSMLAEDAVTTAFIKAFKSADVFEFRNTGSFYAWIKKISVREVLYELRKKRDFLNVDLAGEIPDTMLPEIFEKLQYSDLLRMLESLPATQKTVFLLYVLENYSHHEIGELLGISENHSKQILHRSKNALKIMLNREEDRMKKYGNMGK